MFGKKKAEAFVAGAGPTGMVAALALARNDIDTMIVDTASGTCTRSNALILHPSTLKLFDRLGFAERVIEAGYRIDKVLIYDDTQPRETAHLNELPIAFPFAISMPQWQLESILEEELEREGINVLWDHRVNGIKSNPDGVQVEVDRYTDRDIGYAVSHTERLVDKTLHYDAKFVVAADGYDSLIGRITKQKYQSLAPDQYYAFFEIETDMEPAHAYRVSFKNDLCTAQYPMVGGIARLSFQFSGLTLPPENRHKEREAVQREFDNKEMLDDSHLKELIEQRVPWAAGYVNRIHYRALVPFEKKYLEKPMQNGVFFAGDAARGFGPLSMTSMNLGIQEAEQIAMAYAKGKTPADVARNLEALGQTQASQWKSLARIDRVSMPIEMADPWVTENRARVLRALPATGETLERLAAQLFIHLSLGELVDA